MRWTLRYSREAVNAIYQIPHEIWIEAKSVVWALQDDPLPATAQADEEDPSVYWIALPGDYIVSYEILDRDQTIRILDVA